MNADLRGLVAYAEGRVSHLNRGSCPDAIEGHESRDPDCPVCAALSVAQGQGWRPIESAPRDGWFLAFKPSLQVFVGTVLDADHPDCEFDGGVHESWSHQHVDGVTHWQPLPAAPAQPDGVGK